MEYEIPVNAWSELHVRAWLQNINCGIYGDAFEQNNINGEALLDCDQDTLRELGVLKVGDRIKINVALKHLRAISGSGSVNNIPIHHARSSLYYTTRNPSSPSNHTTDFRDKFTSTSLGSINRDANGFFHPASSSLSTPKTAFNVLNHSEIPVRSQSSLDYRSGSRSPNVSNIALDNVKQSLVKFIGEEGQTRVVNISTCYTAQGILEKAIKKFGKFDESWSNYCVFVTTESGTAILLNDDDLLAICHHPERPERERLILRKKNTSPSVEEFKRAQIIAKEQQDRVDQSSTSHNLSQRIRKLEPFFGEKLSLKRTPTQTEATLTNDRQIKGPSKIIRNFFGQRPPSELISSNLDAYFPGHERRILEETARNSQRFSISRSKRMSMASSKFSLVSTGSAKGNISEIWAQSSAPPRPPRPVSLRKVIPAGLDNKSEEGRDVFRTLSISTNSDSISELSDSDPNTPVALPPYNELNSRFDNDSVVDSSEEEKDITVDNEMGPIKWIRGALIGKGSFGSVYLGLNSMKGGLMAVKQISIPEPVEESEDKKSNVNQALQSEIEFLSQLSNVHIVQYLGTSMDEENLNIFLEYVPGGSVTHLLSEYGPFGIALTKRYLKQILLGLNYLHEKDIIHRDIKGANVLVDHNGIVKISDFGISKKMETSWFASGSSQKPTLQGSVFWMAPEVVKQVPSTVKADIWSLGCLIVEMLTGKRPFPELTQMQAIFKIGTGATPEIPSTTEEDLKALIDRTFEQDQNLRPSAEELLEIPLLATIEISKIGG